jgi:hypothetical protein
LLTGRGHSCVVVAPSLIPMKSGDRVKTPVFLLFVLGAIWACGDYAR